MYGIVFDTKNQNLILDRCKDALKDKPLVDKLQEQYTEVLGHLLSENHPESPSLFARLISIFTELRTASELIREGHARIARLLDLSEFPLAETFLLPKKNSGESPSQHT